MANENVLMVKTEDISSLAILCSALSNNPAVVLGLFNLTAL